MLHFDISKAQRDPLRVRNRGVSPVFKPLVKSFTEVVPGLFVNEDSAVLFMVRMTRLRMCGVYFVVWTVPIYFQQKRLEL